MSASCQEGWEKNGTHCYYWSSNKMNWTEAEDFCKMKGAHLASVTSSAINDYVLEGKARRDLIHLWIGGTDAEVENVWKWTDCSSWEFSFWDTGEPNNFGPTCLVYRPNNKWDDWKCFNKDRFLCSQRICPGKENYIRFCLYFPEAFRGFLRPQLLVHKRHNVYCDHCFSAS